MYQISLSNPMVTKIATSKPKPTSCTTGNPGVRTGRSANLWRRLKLKWLNRMMIHTIIASNKATPNR